VKLSERILEVRKGFHTTFWVANGMELFERLAYYGQATIFSVYLRDHLHFNALDAGTISSIFGSLIYFLPIFAGTIADKIGFRKAFAIAFSVLSVGYFLIGSTGIAPMSNWYSGLPLFWALTPIVILTAMGGSFIKPSVLGTVAVTSKPEVKSVGYAIYYWLVNIGAGLGPLIAYFVRESIGIQYVYLVSAGSCALMFCVNLVFYKEVKDQGKEVVESLGKKMLNLVVVLRNFRFMIFLLIFSLYWVMFWGGLYIIVPWFMRDFISRDAPFEAVLSSGAWAIIVLQLVVNQMTKHIATKQAILIGFGVSSLSWLVIAMHPTTWIIVAGVVVWSIGEMTQAPRYYEYISTLAPKGQQALFQGYAFLPIAIAWLFGGICGGWLYENYARATANPTMVWWVLFGVGALATGLMWLYNTVVTAQESREAGQTF
jgi:POT family proton-dependent oligopeptide transporter